jgi:hypothetical protein
MHKNVRRKSLGESLRSSSGLGLREGCKKLLLGRSAIDLNFSCFLKPLLLL